MNADTTSTNISKCKEPEKRCNVQNNKHDNSCNPQFQMIHVSDTCKVLDNLNESTIQKKIPTSNLTKASCSLPSSTKNVYSTAGKHQTHKLVNSKQILKPFHQSDEKAFLLDTYAHIAAINNKRCSKRLRELAKPKTHSNKNNYSANNFDLNYWNAIERNYTVKTKQYSETDEKIIPRFR